MRVGSLFTGYGGLDMAVGGELVWYSEIDKAACAVLKSHHSEVPNLGDVTQIDWATVEPVDVITGGYPCQPFSQAGLRKGSDDERHLWPYVRDAIDAIRPRRVVLENVRGHLSLGLADVLADLARMGYDARWGLVRASDAGAPHNRGRVFINATDARRSGLQGLRSPAKTVHTTGSSGVATDDRPVSAPDPGSWGRDEGLDEPRNVGQTDSQGAAAFPHGHSANATEPEPAWGKYQPAIERWERLTRPAPSPVRLTHHDRYAINPGFVEWMMGLPEGHVTGHGLRPAQELKMLGNGVVPQQAALALALLE